MTDDLQLLDQCLADADEAMAAIQRDVDQSMPGPDHPMWASAGRRSSKAKQSPKDSILTRSTGAQAPVTECCCQPDDLPHLQQQPRIDLNASVVRCQRCQCQVPKSTRTKQVRWMRNIAQLNQQHPNHVDRAELQRLGLIYAG